jgi:hypothetical protein
MKYDEAPAATSRGSTGKRILTAGKSTDFQRNAPTSLVAAEIHLGRNQRASMAAGCTATFKLCASAKFYKNY